MSTHDITVRVGISNDFSPATVTKTIIGFLNENGIETDKALADKMEAFIKEKLPEIAAIDELRGTLKPPIKAPKYVAAVHGNARDFYIKYYRDDVISGKMTLMKINEQDQNFVQAYNRNNRVTLSQVILSEPKNFQSIKLQSIATLLNSNIETAQSFTYEHHGGKYRR